MCANKRTLLHLLAVILLTIGTGVAAYFLVPRSAVTEPASKTCADYPPFAADWDVVATVPGTSVTFRSPSGGFYGQTSSTAPAVSDLPFVYPSLTPRLAVVDAKTTEAQLLAAAVTDYAADYQRDTWRYAMRVNGRLFLIEADGVNRLFFTATTSLGNKTLSVSIDPWSICSDRAPEHFAPPQLYDFLAHLDFGDAP
jgi:hypothetical protein